MLHTAATEPSQELCAKDKNTEIWEKVWSEDAVESGRNGKGKSEF